MMSFLTTAIIFLSTTRTVYGDDDCADGDLLCPIFNGIAEIPASVVDALLEALAGEFFFDFDDIINDDVKSLAYTLETCIDDLLPLNALDGLAGVVDEIIPLDILDDIGDKMKGVAYTIIAIPLSQNRESLALIQRACGSIDIVLGVTDNYFSSLYPDEAEPCNTTTTTAMPAYGYKRRLVDLEKKCKKDSDNKFCLKHDYKPYINDPAYCGSDYKRQLDSWSLMIPDQEDWVGADTIANYKAIKNAFSTSASFVDAVVSVISKLPGAGFPVVADTVNVLVFWLQLAAVILQRPADVFAIALEYADLHNGYITGSRAQKIMHNSDYILHNQLELRGMIKKIDDKIDDHSRSKRRMIETNESQSNMIRFEMSIGELLMKTVGLIFVGVVLTLSVGFFVWKKKSLPSNGSNVETRLLDEAFDIAEEIMLKSPTDNNEDTVYKF